MKTVSEVLVDVKVATESGNDPDFVAFEVELDEQGNARSVNWEKGIVDVRIDEENREVLLLISPSAEASTTIKLSAFERFVASNPDVSEFTTVVSTEEEVDGYLVRIDRQIIGVGRSNDGEKFAMVTRAE